MATDYVDVEIADLLFYLKIIAISLLGIFVTLMFIFGLELKFLLEW